MEVSIKRSDVKRVANEMLEYSQDFDDEVKRVKNIIESIGTAWNGTDAIKYVNTMRDKYVVKLDELSDLIRSYGEYLQKVPDAYQILDEAFVSRNIDV